MSKSSASSMFQPQKPCTHFKFASSWPEYWAKEHGTPGIPRVNLNLWPLWIPLDGWSRPWIVLEFGRSLPLVLRPTKRLINRSKQHQFHDHLNRQPYFSDLFFLKMIKQIKIQNQSELLKLTPADNLLAIPPFRWQWCTTSGAEITVGRGDLVCQGIQSWKSELIIR